MSISVVVLAAGQGKRMRSDLPKVLHPIAGRPMVEHVLDTVAALRTVKPVVVYGHGGDTLKDALAHRDVTWIEQAEQLGTGHAVAQALAALNADSTALILYGDVPLLTTATLEHLLETAATGFAILTVDMPDPAGYGRIIRNPSGGVERIVEDKDASANEAAISEINTGIMAISVAGLRKWIPRLGADNVQGEYYLTDCVEMAVSEGIEVAGVKSGDFEETMGINDRKQLAQAERIYQRRVADQLMERGVSLVDPARLDVRGTVECGSDVVIDVNVVFRGAVKLGDNVKVGPNNVIADSIVADNVEILPNCVIESAIVGEGARIGPYSRIRPETQLGADVHIGNFVEVKKSSIAEHSKVNHLSYVGDAEIGSRVNVGAGTITCNYDGAFKHKTVIEDDVFIGSDTQLVAPVHLGKGVTVGAGTTVTDDVEPDQLVVSRVRQRSISGWKRPRKDRK